jgi:hypothetical protein
MFWYVEVSSRAAKVALKRITLNRTIKWNFEVVMMTNFHFDLELEEFAKLSGRSLG